MQNRPSQRGMTLIEVMIAMAIIALILGGAVVGMGAIQRGQLRGAANQLAAMIRYARDKAITTNGYYRIRIDLDREQYQLEFSEKAPLLRRTPNPDADSTEKPSQDAANSDDPTKAKPASFEAFQDTTAKSVQFKKGIEFRAVYTFRQTEPQTSGKAYLYFFPDGHTEKSWICIGRANERGNEFLLDVHPLTGKVVLDASCANPPK